MKLSLIALAFCIISIALVCQPVHAKDKSIQAPGYKERSFDKQQLEQIKDDSDFKYAQPSKLTTFKRGIIDRIKYWLDEKIDDLWSGTREEPVKYLLMVLALGLIVYYIVKGRFTGVMGLGSSRANVGEFTEENIHSIDFEKAISEAVAAKEFRLATRLYFLMTLKKMDDRKLISHSRDKTNRQYLYELKNDTMRNEFRWLMRSFEFICYGNTQPGLALFQEVQLRYKDFLTRIEQSRTR